MPERPRTPERSGPERSSHSLVLGKFYPPTPGHELLVTTALNHSDEVTVLVEYAQVETIPGAQRVQWLSEMFPTARVIGMPCDAPMDLFHASVWEAHVTIIKAAMRYLVPAGTAPVDAIFTSERYGDELAARLGVRHIPVDPQRSTVATSGTQVRAALFEQWPTLNAVVQRGLTTRVCVVGAESTGTTTLSRDLARHYRARGGIWADTPWVAEYGRQLSQEKLADLRTVEPAAGMADVTWTGADFARVATVQSAAEDDLAGTGGPLLICDTDAFATRVWERRYLGPAGGNAAGCPVPGKAVYLLTDHVGVPFEQDGLRDGEHVRAQMTAWFTETLTEAGHSWVPVTGTPAQRLSLAARTVDLLLQRRSTFAAPLGAAAAAAATATATATATAAATATATAARP